MRIQLTIYYEWQHLKWQEVQRDRAKRSTVSDPSIRPFVVDLSSASLHWVQ
jgi:hypothetical protein